MEILDYLEKEVIPNIPKKGWVSFGKRIFPIVFWIRPGVDRVEFNFINPSDREKQKGITLGYIFHTTEERAAEYALKLLKEEIYMAEAHVRELKQQEENLRSRLK